MIVGFNHLGIVTHNFDRLVAFYRDTFGFKQIGAGAWDVGTREIDEVMALQDTAARFVVLQCGNAALEIFEFRSPSGRAPNPARQVNDGGVNHFCFAVRDIDCEVERLKEAGMTFHSPPTKRRSQSPVRFVYGRDPDGNVVELMEIFGESRFAFETGRVDWRTPE